MSAIDTATVESLLGLTLAMDEAAREEDWERVVRHDAERRRLLDAEGAGGSGPPPPALLGALLEADRAMLKRARRMRETLVESTHRVRTERDARQSYTAIMQSVGIGVE